MICVSDSEMKTVLEIIKKQSPDCDVLAYGSRYKWTPKDYSDLDLAFALPNGEKLETGRIIALQEAFMESDLPYRVDVADYNAVSAEFRAVIDVGNETIYRGFKMGYNGNWGLLGMMCKLGDMAIQIIDGDRGKNYPNEFTENGHCLFLSAKNVTSNGFYFDNMQFITKERDELLRKGKLIRNDVVLTTRGTVGNVAFYDKLVPYDNIRINSGMVILRTDPKLIEPHFLYYAMKSPSIKNQILQMQTGSAQPQLPISHMVNLFIPKLPLATQQQISSTLSTFDAKIANNKKINHNLEQLAQVIFKAWFVDFLPFGGVMPGDWREGTLSEIANITMGQSPSGSSYNEESIGTVFYQGRAEFGLRFPTRRLFTTQPKRMAAKSDVLMSVRAPVGDLNVAYENCCIGRGLSAIRSKNNCQSFVLYTMFGLKQKLDMFNGEGTVFGSINKNDMANLPVIIPTNEIMCQFEELVNPIDTAIATEYTESCNLQAVRDSLLPRLISGELQIPNTSENK